MQPRFRPFRSRLALLLAPLLVLAGCSSTRLIDSSVQAFSTLPSAPALPATSYRFERLPSQQAPTAAAAQSALEYMAEQALAKVGLQRNDGQARYVVQVGHTTSQRLRDYGYGGLWGGPGWGWGLGAGWSGRRGFIGGSWGFPPTVLYLHEIGLVMRDSSNNQIVYETHAMTEDLWRGDAAALGAMLDAALRDFPQPPAGMRRIPVEIPRQAPAAPASTPAPALSSEPKPQP